MINLILYFILTLTLLLFLIFMTFYSLSLIYSSLKGSPYVPTKNKVLIEMFDEVKFVKGKKFLELGSGDGRICRYASSRFGIYTTGIDVNILLVWWARFLTKSKKLDKLVSFKTENIFDADFRGYDYIYIFLMPKLISDLEPKFKKELKKGAIIISHGFPIEGLKKNLFKKLKKIPFPTYYYKI